MKNIKNTLLRSFLITSIVVISLTACENEQSPGVEYMPDMYRSPAIEAYVDYNYPDSMTSLLTPENSIPRGYKPYAYANNDEGMELAGNQLTYPFQLTEKNIAEGKELYESFCAHCHGQKGKGEGSIQNPIYGAVPSYVSDVPNRRGGRSMKELKAGHIYHTIMYGLNAMGPHSSLIREQDRWKIVAYVQKLQGKDPMAVQKTTEVNQEESEVETTE